MSKTDNYHSMSEISVRKFIHLPINGVDLVGGIWSLTLQVQKVSAIRAFVSVGTEMLKMSI